MIYAYVHFARGGGFAWVLGYKLRNAKGSRGGWQQEQGGVQPVLERNEVPKLKRECGPKTARYATCLCAAGAKSSTTEVGCERYFTGL